jgi:hypothetical protein
MHDLGPNVSMWWLMGIQIMGLASAWLARISEGSKHQVSYQLLFFCCLGGVGAATIGALLTSPGSCLMTGATLPIMVLAATWDFSAGKRAAL